MQIEQYKPDNLNLTEFIDAYRLDMILNNNIISNGEFELYNYNEMLEIEKEEYASENEAEILEIYYTDYRETSGGSLEDIKNLIDETKEEFINDHLEEIEENLYLNDIYQYFIINDPDTWSKYTNYPIYYSDELDIYLLGITHYGTSWSFFFTDAPRPQHMKVKKYDEILSGTTSTA